MDLTVYMHNGCPTFTRSARLMMEHLRTEHSPVTAPLLATEGGIALLDGQISEHLLAVTPPGTATNVCLTCNIIMGTRFDADNHLSLPQHVVEYSRVLQNTGDAGVRVLLDRRWITTTLKAEHDFSIAPAARTGRLQSTSTSLSSPILGTPGQLRYLQSFYGHENQPAQSATGSSIGTHHHSHPNRGSRISVRANSTTESYFNAPVSTAITMPNAPPSTAPKILRLAISNYTTRPRFPPFLNLRVLVPHTTRTVADLAACIETAFIADPAGEANAIGWADYIAICGIKFRDGRAGMIRADADVAAWVADAGEEEETAEIKRRVWVAGM